MFKVLELSGLFVFLGGLAKIFSALGGVFLTQNTVSMGLQPTANQFLILSVSSYYKHYRVIQRLLFYHRLILENLQLD